MRSFAPARSGLWGRLLVASGAIGAIWLLVLATMGS